MISILYDNANIKRPSKSSKFNFSVEWILKCETGYYLLTLFGFGSISITKSVPSLIPLTANSAIPLATAPHKAIFIFLLIYCPFDKRQSWLYTK